MKFISSQEFVNTLSSFRYKAHQKIYHQSSSIDKNKKLFDQMISTSRNFSISGSNRHYRTFSYISTDKSSYQEKSVVQSLNTKKQKIKSNQQTSKKQIKQLKSISQKQNLNVKLELKERIKHQKLQNIKLKNPFYKIMKKRSVQIKDHKSIEPVQIKQNENLPSTQKFDGKSLKNIRYAKIPIKINKINQNNKQKTIMEHFRSNKFLHEKQKQLDTQNTKDDNKISQILDKSINITEKLLQYQRQQEQPGIRQKSQTVKYYDIKKYFEEKYQRKSKHKNGANLSRTLQSSDMY